MSCSGEEDGSCSLDLTDGTEKGDSCNTVTFATGGAWPLVVGVNKALPTGSQTREGASFAKNLGVIEYNGRVDVSRLAPVIDGFTDAAV